MQKYTDTSRRRSRGSTGYQRCDLSDTLLLKDNNDEYHTAKYPLIDIEPIFWILNSIFWNLRHYKPFCYQLNGRAWRIMLPTTQFFQLSRFSTTHREGCNAGPAREFWLRSSIITLHNSCNGLIHDTGQRISDVWPWSDILVCAQPSRILV